MSVFDHNPLIIFRTESTWTEWDNDKISLCRNNKGEFFLKGKPKRKQQFPDLAPNTNKIKRVSVTKEWVASVFERLASSQIPAYPMLDMGCDGSFTELEIGSYAGKAHYRWWADAPESWKILEKIGEEIHSKFYSE